MRARHTPRREEPVKLLSHVLSRSAGLVEIIERQSGAADPGLIEMLRQPGRKRRFSAALCAAYSEQEWPPRSRAQPPQQRGLDGSERARHGLARQ
jgi:hypothetical protein